MSALSRTEKEKEKEKEQEKEETVRFIAADKNEWIFKKEANGTDVTLSVAGEECGKVTLLEYNESSRNLTVTCQSKQLKTPLNRASVGAAIIIKKLETFPVTMNITKKTEARLMLRMMAAVNGRSNFDNYLPLMARERPESCKEITRETLVKMLKRENEVRLSKEMLEILEKEASEYEDGDSSCSTDKLSCRQPHTLASIVQCQEKVVREFGYTTSAEISYAVQTLRSARALFPNDMEIQNAVFYLKYNRAHRGKFKVNDSYKDVPLMTCAQEATKLSEILNPEKATVIISGSVT